MHAVTGVTEQTQKTRMECSAMRATVGAESATERKVETSKAASPSQAWLRSLGTSRDRIYNRQAISTAVIFEFFVTRHCLEALSDYLPTIYTYCRMLLLILLYDRPKQLHL